MKRRIAIAVLSMCALAAGGYLAWTGVPGRTPAGQPALTALHHTAIDDLRDEFNGAADDVRVIVLLSPT